MTCEISWNVPVIRACDAMMAARIEMMNPSQNSRGGADLKKGLEYALGWSLMYAAWPM
jgi:hypothetical protein